MPPAASSAHQPDLVGAYNAHTVKRLYADVFNRHRLDLAGRYFHRNYSENDPGISDGIAGLKQYYSGTFFKAFPDATVTIDRLVAQDNRVYVMTTWQGTNAQTGKELKLNIADVYRLSEGRVAEHWDIVDYSALTPHGFPAQHGDQPAYTGPVRGTPAQLANVGLFNRFVDTVLRPKNLNALSQFVIEDFLQHDPTIGPGLEGFRHCTANYFAAVPQMTFTIQHVIADENHIAVFWILDGDVAGTNIHYHLPTADMYTVRDGMLVEHWNIRDFTSEITPES